MVDVLHTVIQTILYVRSSEVRNLNHAHGGMYHHRVASKVIVMCRQQWQADQQKKIIAKMAGKMPGKTNEGKRKINDRNHHTSNVGGSSTRQGNTSQVGRGGRGRGPGGRGERGNNSDHLKNVECFSCGKKGQYSTDCSLPRKNDSEQPNMVSKADFKNLFQSSLK
jgi:hypothetical protein